MSGDDSQYGYSLTILNRDRIGSNRHLSTKIAKKLPSFRLSSEVLLDNILAAKSL